MKKVMIILRVIAVFFCLAAAGCTGDGNGSNATSTSGSSQLVAGFTADPVSGSAPLVVNFTDASTGSATGWSWTFGDGETSTVKNPSHTFAAAGTYTVSLTVTNTGGSSTVTQSITVSTAVSALAYPVVDTGQTLCYGAMGTISAPAAGQAFYGQDAQYNGLKASYTLSGDGLTVKDNNTGLTWQRSPDTNLDGSITYADKLTYAQAQDYPATLNAKKFGGYSDWRLPTVKELYSLMNFSGEEASAEATSGTTKPFLDTNYFKFSYGFLSDNERIIDAQYLTTTTYVANPTNQMFGVNFADGRIKGYPLQAFTSPTGWYGVKPYFVICVRGNADYGKNTFVDNGDSTVTDKATGRMWTQKDSGTGMDWEAALSWVQTQNAANYLGHSDWRLPNAKELQSIVDYTRSPDTTNSAAIDPVFSCTQITNENYQSDYPWYWTGTTLGGPNGMDDGGIYIAFGRTLGFMNGTWQDVHGAGAQRSDPKTTAELSRYTKKDNGYYSSMAPQGDAVRVNNYVRLVRDIK